MLGAGEGTVIFVGGVFVVVVVDNSDCERGG
jgi:hypothetical protein